MRQLTTLMRCLGIALALVAAFVTLSPAQPASALSRADLETLCVNQGGIYFESFNVWGSIEYGCWFNDDSEMQCITPGSGPGRYVSGTCVYYPGGAGDYHGPHAPEPHIGEPLPNSSQPAGGEVADRYS
jgi:hypothetical protein